MFRKRAFTLIELLVVIAITAILMGIIVVPIIQSLNLTRAAQAFADAQDKARTLTERIAREINNSEGVRDNSGTKGELDIVVPAKPGSALTVAGYDNTRELTRVPIFNAKLDLIKPFEGDPGSQSGGAFLNPYTGMYDPTLHAPKGQVMLPAAPGMTIVRYWVGLRDPLRTNNGGYLGYNEPFTGLFANIGGRDNLFVLYRAEVLPYIWSNTQNKFVVNKAFFYDQSRNTYLHTTGTRADDPRFFDPAAVGVDDTFQDPTDGTVHNYYKPSGDPDYNVADPDNTPDPTKEQMVQNWLRAATIQTEVSRYDMIQPIYDLRTRQIQYDGNAPRLMTLVSFQPTRVSSEPAEGQMAVRLGEESEGSSTLAPDVFLTKYAGWANTIVRTYPQGYTAGSNQLYEVGLALRSPGATDPRGFSIYGYDPTQTTDDTRVGQPNGLGKYGYELMDMDTYIRGVKNGIRGNFSRAIAAANTRSAWLGDNNLRTLFTPYFPDFNRGRVLASFAISEVATVGTAPDFTPTAINDPTNPSALPGGPTWTSPDATDPMPTEPKSPFNDYPRTAGNAVDLSAGTFSDPQYVSINRKFNKIWFDMQNGALPDMRPDVHRFIDLRVTPMDDFSATASPLNPDRAIGFARARIVPGSEQVFGPDQNPGAAYGRVVRYTRTSREPGPNQYRMNFTDLPEPDYTLLGLTPPPANYDPTNFVSAVIQPRYKAGYIQFNSDPNVPLPNNKIRVYYRFQFTQAKDVMAVDYDSRQLMTVQMTIRNLPQSTIPNPQSVTLRATASVRNFLR